jgi:uncharacterized alpha-E superfamily protein
MRSTAPISSCARSSARRAPTRLLPKLCDWTKRQGSILRGTTEATHLQNDGYDFLNLGTYIERADNTARVVDVKYYVLLPTVDMVGTSIDTYQWTTLLRALSAFRSFHWAYRGDYTPRKIAHFLILNQACPRSLLHCVDMAGFHLNRLARAYDRTTLAHDRARDILSRARRCRDRGHPARGAARVPDALHQPERGARPGPRRRLPIRGAMTMRLSVFHRTRYRYDRPARFVDPEPPA